MELACSIHYLGIASLQNIVEKDTRQSSRQRKLVHYDLPRVFGGYFSV